MSSLIIQASPIPCLYWTKNIKQESYPEYDISNAYKAADLVIVGEAENFVQGKPQKINVIKTIKGTVNKVIDLVGTNIQGTEVSGSAIQIKKEFLMLLAKDSKYKWVDSGSGCPNSFEVNNGQVKIGNNVIELNELKNFFEKNPNPIH
jgi:hypothetical protein